MYIPDEIKQDAREHFMRIRELNDALRTCADPILRLVINGQLVITSGIHELGDAYFKNAVAAVRAFNDFTPDNDPHGEHDFGSFELVGRKFFWKIDAYDANMEFGSEDPADPARTVRVLTIMLAEEY